MASTCIRRPRSGRFAYLCSSPDNKPSISLPPGAALPARLTIPGSGAPEMCPECVVRHALDRPPRDGGRETLAVALPERVDGEVLGLPQATSTLERYGRAVAEVLSSGRGR